MSPPPLLVSRAGAVVTLTINRPERLNAMDSVAHLALSEALDTFAEDASVRVLVLTGAGSRAFSVGRDLKELSATLSEREQDEIDARWQRITRLTDRFDYPKPIIARVQGLALGGGFELALACDIVVATEGATFALPEAQRGLIPFAGGVHRLPRQIPERTALGMMLTGRSIDAARALQLGLINEVTATELIDEAVERWTQEIVAAAPLSVRAIKQCVALGAGRPLHEAIAAAYPAEEARKISRDSQEGPRAFAEKRAPVWRGQ
ncbi:MAG: enoyl-CoA hydratase-related protein [Hyphomonadaceae bacterium]